MATTVFKSGDIVRLKSGSPLMTVRGMEGPEAITVWFEGESKKEGRFPLATLVHAQGAPAPR